MIFAMKKKKNFLPSSYFLFLSIVIRQFSFHYSYNGICDIKETFRFVCVEKIFIFFLALFYVLCKRHRLFGRREGRGEEKIKCVVCFRSHSITGFVEKVQLQRKCHIEKWRKYLRQKFSTNEKKILPFPFNGSSASIRGNLTKSTAWKKETKRNDDNKLLTISQFFSNEIAC